MGGIWFLFCIEDASKRSIDSDIFLVDGMKCTLVVERSMLFCVTGQKPASTPG